LFVLVVYAGFTGNLTDYLGLYSTSGPISETISSLMLTISLKQLDYLIYMLITKEWR
jgi:hypothetical protein